MAGLLGSYKKGDRLDSYRQGGGLLDVLAETELGQGLLGLATDPVGQTKKAVSTVANKVREANRKNKEAFESGNNDLIASRALDYSQDALGFAPIGMTVWHGSPHKFDKFDMSKIGTEQDGKLFGGAGMHMADNVSDASRYGENLYKVDIPDEAIVDLRDKANFMRVLGNMKPKGQDKTLSEIANEYELAKQSANIEKVYLKEERPGFFDVQWFRNGDWESNWPNRASSLELSDDPSGMAYALSKILPQSADRFMSPSAFSPEDVRAAVLQSGKKASFFDGSIGHAGDELAVFDDQLPRILEINGQATGNQPWARGEWGLLK